ncbi:hypothetical protein H4R35_007594, partial [Dimargaris xerosporica]
MATLASGPKRGPSSPTVTPAHSRITTPPPATGGPASVSTDKDEPPQRADYISSHNLFTPELLPTLRQRKRLSTPESPTPMDVTPPTQCK